MDWSYLLLLLIIFLKIFLEKLDISNIVKTSYRRMMKKEFCKFSDLKKKQNFIKLINLKIHKFLL